jgi:hemerythrin
MPIPHFQEIKWLDAYALGIPEIDGDHRTIVVLMQMISDAATSPDRERIEMLFDRVIAFARSHFKREEFFLRHWNYPDVLDHAKYHQDLVTRAEKAKHACLDLQQSTAFVECCNSLVSFIVDDVIRGDLKFKSFLQEKGLIQ